MFDPLPAGREAYRTVGSVRMNAKLLNGVVPSIGVTVKPR